MKTDHSLLLLVQDDVANLKKEVRSVREEILNLSKHLETQLSVDDLQCVNSTKLKKILNIGDDKLTELVSKSHLKTVNLPGHHRFNLLQVAHDLGISILNLKARAIMWESDWSNQNREFDDFPLAAIDGLNKTHLVKLKALLNIEQRRIRRENKAKSELIEEFKNEFGEFFG